MNTCTFTYISRETHLPRTTTGTEYAWEDLKILCNREGEGYPGAKYYKTISPEGPELFAVVNQTMVLYHDKGKWIRYLTAKNIQFDIRTDFRVGEEEEVQIGISAIED
ncbi:unnamed protein product [Didymodactylos carnosus]|uniref:Uncharacterized protein n=1 Tax=Didymodactylos carnosus TaxID=1234261 RepID=A0A815MJF7_9BILA|nr:unnamed protein product [Didymodactylos carnosus]CAF4305526.1 unnamed protein product [Didymodactylos carnosus]